MIIEKSSDSFVRFLIFAAGLGFMLSGNIRAAADQSSGGHQTDLAVIESLFKHFTKPVPNKMRLAVKIEETSQPWTEEQILAAVKLQEDSLKGIDRNIGEVKTRQLRELRIESMRKFSSGFKTVFQQEWFDGREFWRGDSTDTSMTKDYNPTKNGEYFESVVNYPRTNTAHTMKISAGIPSAAIYEATTTKFNRYDLWEAYIVEPPAALLFVSLLMDRTLSKKPEDCLNTSYEGMRFDTAKAVGLLAGKETNIDLRITHIVSNSINMITVALTDKKGSGGEVRYFLDAEHLDHILRIELMGKKDGTKYISERSEFDKDDFPRLWVYQAEANGKIVAKKRCEYTLVDLTGSNVNASVFSPHFPTNYLVVKIGQNSKSEFIQNPYKSSGFIVPTPVATVSPQPPQIKRYIILFCLAGLVAIPAFFLFRKKKGVT